MKKPLSKETLIEMLPLIGWRYYQSPNGLNDALITQNDNPIKLEIRKDRLEFRDMHKKESDSANVSYRMEFKDHEIEYHKKENFISIFIKGQENPGTFMLLSGE